MLSIAEGYEIDAAMCSVCKEEAAYIYIVDDIGNVMARYCPMCYHDFLKEGEGDED